MSVDGARIGFAGLGQMGFHLAGHVEAAATARGVSVVAYDPSAEMRERAVAAGRTTTDEPLTELGDGDLLCISVPDGAAVRAVIAGLGDLGRCSGLVILDFSSVSPGDAVEIGTMAATHGVRYVDAPVTGGVAAAELGTLTTIAGSNEADLEAIAWVAEAFSKKVVYAGQLGSGALLKSVNNMIFNVASIASMEGILLARSAGITDDVLLDVLNNGTGVTYFSQVRYPRYIASGGFDAGMRVGLVNKDLQIALDAAEAAGVDLEFCNIGRRMWADALDVLDPGADSTEMMDMVSKRVSGVPVRDVLGLH